MTVPVRVSVEAFSVEVREVLRAVDALLGPGREGWVVGGAVRDALLGRAAGDLDLAVPTGALRLGRALADGLGWSFVMLDAERGVCRIVGDLQIDIADFRGPDLGADLAGRDFTVNALAASVADARRRGHGGCRGRDRGIVGPRGKTGPVMRAAALSPRTPCAPCAWPSSPCSRAGASIRAWNRPPAPPRRRCARRRRSG